VSSGLVFWEGTERLANYGNHPHTQTGRRDWTYYRASLSIALLEKRMSSAVKKRCLEIIEPKVDDTQCGFRPGQNFSHPKVFEKSLEYRAKTSRQELCWPRASIRPDSLWKALWSVAGLSSLCITARTFVSLLADLNRNCSQWVLDSSKSVCYHQSSS